jgi:hypothetical protein
MQVFCSSKPQTALYCQGRQETLSDAPQIRWDKAASGLVARFSENRRILHAPANKWALAALPPPAGFETPHGNSSPGISLPGKSRYLQEFRRIATLSRSHLATQDSSYPTDSSSGTSPLKRRQLVEDFQREGGPPFHPLVQAGGTDSTSPGASHVIHFDRGGTAVENQTTDRAFRIGQKNVLVHQFVTHWHHRRKNPTPSSDKQQMCKEIPPRRRLATLTELSDD